MIGILNERDRLADVLADPDLPLSDYLRLRARMRDLIRLAEACEHVGRCLDLPQDSQTQTLKLPGGLPVVYVFTQEPPCHRLYAPSGRMISLSGCPTTPMHESAVRAAYERSEWFGIMPVWGYG